MHELAIAQQLVELAGEHARRAGARRVTRLNCRIGALRRLESDLMSSAFEIARAGTACEEAELVVECVPIRARCPICAQVFAVADWNWRCPDCAVEGEPLPGGDELELISIDADNELTPGAAEHES
ncbi:Hydrogenase/urease nickel incorporation protein HypA [Phycisphaerae bacterium RAS1]|nr:Hydrogenase/urease nickel incorporation protein HypA [Phycisphaerae bacterium RAS1]